MPDTLRGPYQQRFRIAATALAKRAAADPPATLDRYQSPRTPTSGPPHPTSIQPLAGLQLPDPLANRGHRDPRRPRRRRDPAPPRAPHSPPTTDAGARSAPPPAPGTSRRSRPHRSHHQFRPPKPRPCNIIYLRALSWRTSTPAPAAVLPPEEPSSQRQPSCGPPSDVADSDKRSVGPVAARTTANDCFTQSDVAQLTITLDWVGAGLTPAPPTPPDMRVRIRRFAQHSRKRRYGSVNPCRPWSVQ